VGSTSSLDVVEKRKNLLSLPGCEPWTGQSAA